MNKFENVDVLAALEQIMCQNTAFYQDDFEIDKEMIRKAAASDKAEDKTLLWMSRPSGTYCFRGRILEGHPTIQHMEILWGADPRPCSCLRRGADRQSGRENPWNSL